MMVVELEVLGAVCHRKEKGSGVNSRIRFATNALLGASVAVALFLALSGVDQSRAKTSRDQPATDSRTGTSAVEVGSATLSAAASKTWGHFWAWHTDRPYCIAPFEVLRTPDDPGSIVAGFKHRVDKGAKLFGCPDGSNTVYRGTVWFDLSEIASKAPPLHVVATVARLSFKQLDVACPGELLVGTADWSKGFTDNALVPGDPFAKLGACGSEDCIIDVKTVVNNWLNGEEHGGYANYGFVFKGNQEDDVKWGNNESCLARYGDFRLTVEYKYDKEPGVLHIPLPAPAMVAKPEISSPVGQAVTRARTNFALAANGAVAKSSSAAPGYAASGAIDGDELGVNFGKNGYWSSADDSLPAWLEVAFSGIKSITEIDLFTIQDDFKSPSTPTPTMIFTKYGLTDFEVQYWNETTSDWVGIASGPMKENKLVWNKFSFSPIKTSRIRILSHGSPDSYSRVAELEAWSN